MKKIIALVFAAALFSTPLHAQQNTTVQIDLTKVDKTTATRILETIESERQAKTKAVEVAKEVEKVIPTPQKAAEWANVGENIAKAISATAKALSIEVNDFTKTPVGMITMGLVIWYFIGAKLWSIVGGTVAWIALVTMAYKSFAYFHKARRRIVKETGTGKERVREYEETFYPWRNHEAKTFSAVMHVMIFLTINIVFVLKLL